MYQHTVYVSGCVCVGLCMDILCMVYTVVYTCVCVCVCCVIFFVSEFFRPVLEQYAMEILSPQLLALIDAFLENLSNKSTYLNLLNDSEGRSMMR